MNEAEEERKGKAEGRREKDGWERGEGSGNLPARNVTQGKPQTADWKPSRGSSSRATCWEFPLVITQEKREQVLKPKRASSNRRKEIIQHAQSQPWNSLLRDAADAETPVSAGAREGQKPWRTWTWSLVRLNSYKREARLLPLEGRHPKRRLYCVCCGPCPFPGHTKDVFLWGTTGVGGTPEGPGDPLVALRLLTGCHCEFNGLLVPPDRLRQQNTMQNQAGRRSARLPG